LDIASSLSPGFDAERAIFTCAIAVHCDRREYKVAAKLERQQAERSIDLKFARACARLYSELYGESEDEGDRARRDAYVAAINSLDAEASVAA
jgi:hypothetical protein